METKTPTPRTDELCLIIPPKEGINLYKIKDFARQLERELSEAKIDNQTFNGQMNRLQERYNKLYPIIAERDALQKKVDEITKANQTANRLIGLQAQENDKINQKLQSDLAKARADSEMFPMLDGFSIPVSVARIIYAGYSSIYGRDQSFERIKQRGGFGWKEVPLIWDSPVGRVAILAAMKNEPNPTDTHLKL